MLQWYPSGCGALLAPLYRVSDLDRTKPLRERALLSPSEKTALRTFRQYMVTPGKMLCFFGPSLEKHKAALHQLTESDLLVKEEFKGAYSLTHAGFEAMKSCDN
jgi:hypothetical protein